MGKNWWNKGRTEEVVPLRIVDRPLVMYCLPATASTN